MKMKYTEQAVETLDDAGSVIANKNIEIEQLRQRVAELEKEVNYHMVSVAVITAERDSAYKIADHYRDERDKATQYWNIAEGRCDALLEANRTACTDIVERHNRIAELKKQRDELLAALYVITKRPVIEAFSIAEAAIASVKEKA